LSSDLEVYRFMLQYQQQSNITPLVREHGVPPSVTDAARKLGVNKGEIVHALQGLAARSLAIRISEEGRENRQYPTWLVLRPDREIYLPRVMRQVYVYFREKQEQSLRSDPRARYGWPPSLDEICRAVGLRKRWSAVYRLHRLIRAGMVVAAGQRGSPRRFVAIPDEEEQE
jgi:SOS-response transcriptional repressor LexA